jgi:putative membrane protein
MLAFMRVVRGVLAGFFGGLVAAGAMSLAHNVLSALVLKPPALQPSTPKEEDATVKVAAAVAGSVGYQLSEEAKPKAGTFVHYAFGAGVGAVYGALGELAPLVRAGLGLPFGAAVWLGAHVITVPALGLAKPPTQQPLGKEAQELGLHLVYGLVTEVVRRLLGRG